MLGPVAGHGVGCRVGVIMTSKYAYSPVVSLVMDLGKR